ncbi:MAG: family 20 glycosylhydrolase [Anaerolineae bacterium]|nr:family 20 glycosylhydrolase [Anaerolineae bacterium]
MTPSELVLLPYPQHIDFTGGSVTLPETGRIALPESRGAELAFVAQRAQAALARHARLNWPIEGEGPAAALTFTWSDRFPSNEGYRLAVSAEGIGITARAVPGAFYAVATLVQLLQTHGRTLPALVIDDWPDFAARGVMLDISRDKVPTMETLYQLVDLLAGWKINQLQLYTEHTFAYAEHREVWEHASPMTAEQIRALDAYCRERCIELVPNQNSFGHMHRWFDHPRYLALAETDAPFRAPWGTMLPPFSLSPAAPGSLPFLERLYAELLPNFSSRLFNVGCDETFDLGLGRSRELVEARGKGRVYLDFLLEIYQLVKQHGRTMQFWGDIINQYPELVAEVPKDTIALEWGYEADHDFEGKTRLFAESGVPFYVCPGTSSWSSFAGRTDNCLANIRSATAHGLEHGAIGLLNTDWGDNGHWQPLPVSYLGFAYGAALSWAYGPNVERDLPLALDTFAFQDDAQIMGRIAYDLGNLYQVSNQWGSLLFNVYLSPLKPEQRSDEGLRARLHDTLDRIDAIIKPLERARMAAPDADLIKREFAHVARLLRHGAKRALFQMDNGEFSGDDLAREFDELVAGQREIWLMRNRPGGLNDSIARLAGARELYAG